MTDFSKIKQQLEILWQTVEKLETEGGGSSDSYTKAQTDALLADKADKSTTYTKTQVDGEILGAINDLDVSSTAATGHYIKSIEQENGKISAVAELIDTEPITGSTKPITSGAVYTALQNLPSGGGIETVELTKSGSTYYWPSDKLSYFASTGNPKVIYVKYMDSGNIDIAWIDIIQNNSSYGYYYTLGTFKGDEDSDVFKNASLLTARHKVNKTNGSITNFVPNDIMTNSIILGYINGVGWNGNSWGNTYPSIGGKDLNNFTDAGVYYCSAANSSNMSHSPVVSKDMLITNTQIATNRLIQTIELLETPTIYKRTQVNNVWTNWFEFSGTEIVPTP